MAHHTIAADDTVRKQLEQIHRHLQVVHSGITVSAAALRAQNCDHDEDVARVLLYGVGDRLVVQMDLIAEIVASLHPSGCEPTMPVGPVEYRH